MTEGTEYLAARLAALEGSTGKAKANKRPAPLAAILGVVGIAAAGCLAWAALQLSAEAPMATAAPEEFQSSGPGFGDLAPISTPEPSQAPPADTGPSESELALMESLATFRA